MTTKPKSREPRITDRVIDGVLQATNLILAGDVDKTNCDEDAVIAAHDWAFDMRNFRRATKAKTK